MYQGPKLLKIFFKTPKPAIFTDKLLEMNVDMARLTCLVEWNIVEQSEGLGHASQGKLSWS